MRLPIELTFCLLLTSACGSSSSQQQPLAASGGAAGSSGGAGSSGAAAGGAGSSSTAGAGNTSAGAPAAAGAAGAAGAATASKLSISPPQATLSPKGSQTFTCSVACTFAVQEGATGGAVTPQGVYTAPEAFGTYHVVATAQINGAAQTASAAITVPQPATGKIGEWERVTSSEMDPSFFTGASGFGVGNIVTDPGHPSDMYVGGYGAIFKSTDFGLTWHKVPSNPNPPYQALGHVLVVAGTTPATVWMAAANGDKHVYKSTDAGLTFKQTGTLTENPTLDGGFYSLILDPYDNNHLLTGFHEMDKLAESTDGGETWHYVGGTDFPSGGKSWFPYFIDTGKGDTTAKTWFAIAQDGGSATMTTDGGKSWVKPKGLEGLQHPHGTAGIYQNGNSVFVAGSQGPGDGVYRSTDLGANWKRIAEKSGGIVFGSSKNLYAMWGWACGSCGIKEGGPMYQTSAYPGDSWSMGTLPDGLVWGPNSIAITTDGTHQIFVGSMWSTGLWRYVEP